MPYNRRHAPSGAGAVAEGEPPKVSGFDESAIEYCKKRNKLKITNIRNV